MPDPPYNSQTVLGPVVTHTEHCPNQDLLAQYALGKISEADLDTIAAHVETCSVCQTQLENLDCLTDAVVEYLRRSIPEEPDSGDSLVDELLPKVALAWWQYRAGLAEQAPEPALPLQIGPYQLVEKLGEGGMGVVYKALDTKLNRPVAVKLMPDCRRQSPHALARFHREMVAAARVDHPNIVRAHDADEVDGRFLLVMQFVEGADLYSLVRRVGPLDVAEACEIIRQAAVGLQHAHQNDLVHRDIKPSNLMLTTTGVVKLLDLGLARLQIESSAQGDMTTLGQILGSPDYMAPEQGADPHAADARSDIYALGCTLYFLLAGSPPFGDQRHDGFLKKLVAHASEEVVPIQRIRHDVPSRLARFLGKMLAKRPADRCATAAEVAEALQPFCLDSDLVAIVRGERPQRPKKRAASTAPKSLVSEQRPGSPKAAAAAPVARAKPSDGSPAVVDGKYEQEASGSSSDSLPSGPPGSLDAVLATLGSSDPSLGTLGTNIVLGSDDEASPGQPASRRSPNWRWMLVAASAGLAAVVVAVIMAMVVLGQTGLVGPEADGQPTPTAGAKAARGDPLIANAPAAPKNDNHVKEPLQKTVAQQPSRPLSPPGQPPPKRGKRKAPKPSPPPQKAPPAGPSKPVEPFKDLAAAAPLPSLPADDKQLTAPSQPVSLGKLRLAADAKPQVSLIGENVFLRQVGRYAVRPEPGSGAARAWVIQVKVGSDPSASHSDPDLARIWLDHSELKMGWLPGAKRSWTDPLQTCGLLVSVGNQSRMVALCRPQEVEPLSIKIEYDPTSRQMSYLADTRRLPCQFLPPESLRLEVTGLARPFPPFTLEPGRPIAPTEKVDIRLDNPQLPPTVLQVEFEVQSHIANFTVTPLCALPGLTQPSATKEAKTPSASADGPKDAPELTPFQRDQFSDLADKLTRRFLSRASHSRGKERERLLGQLKSDLAQCEALGDLLHALRKENPDRENQARAVYFRLFRQIGDCQVDLLVARPPKSAADPKPPPKQR